MPQGEHSAILPTFIKLPFAIKTFVLSFFEWSLKTVFTVLHSKLPFAILSMVEFIHEYSLVRPQFL